MRTRLLVTAIVAVAGAGIAAAVMEDNEPSWDVGATFEGARPGSVDVDACLALPGVHEAYVMTSDPPAAVTVTVRGSRREALAIAECFEAEPFGAAHVSPDDGRPIFSD